MSQIFLKEDILGAEANLVESFDTQKNYYLSGIMMMGNCTNGNRRIYKTAELQQVVVESMEKISKGELILGELQHPENLTINLQNVSHAITEMRMDGDNVVGKMKLLKTPAGEIAKAIMEGGARLGVSSRGAGNVGEGGVVSGFNFLTVDIVHTPSAPNAKPDLIREHLENPKLLTLAEAVIHDEAAQKHLRLEIKKVLYSILNK